MSLPRCALATEAGRPLTAPAVTPTNDSSTFRSVPSGMFRVQPWKWDDEDDEPEPFEPPTRPDPPEKPLEILRY